VIKILVLNRMHLDEWPAGQVESMLTSLAGHPAITGFSRQAPAPGRVRRRGYDGNITDCFPGHPRGHREERDAWQITQLSRSADLVLDIHGTRRTDETFPFYGPEGRTSPLIKGVAALLASDCAVIPGAPHPAGVLAGYVGWDLAPGSTILQDLPGWLRALAAGWTPPARPMAEYRYAQGIRQEDAERLGLQREYPPFTRLPDLAMCALGLPLPGYALSWNADLNGHTGYWGEIVVPAFCAIGSPQAQTRPGSDPAGPEPRRQDR
jgi:hypothetical protein